MFRFLWFYRGEGPVLAVIFAMAPCLVIRGLVNRHVGGNPCRVFSGRQPGLAAAKGV